LKSVGTRAETGFRLSAKRTSPFKKAVASVPSTTGSRGGGISSSNTGYTMFRDSVKSTGYPLHSPVSPSLPLPASTCAITFKLDCTRSGALNVDLMKTDNDEKTYGAYSIKFQQNSLYFSFKIIILWLQNKINHFPHFRLDSMRNGEVQTVENKYL
jgi:hypothetical protein